MRACKSGGGAVQRTAPNVHKVGACGVADEQLAVGSEVVVAAQHPGHPAQAAWVINVKPADSKDSSPPPALLRWTSAQQWGHVATVHVGHFPWDASVLQTTPCTPPQPASVRADGEEVAAGIPALAARLAAANAVDEHQAGAVAAEQRPVDPPDALLMGAAAPRSRILQPRRRIRLPTELACGAANMTLQTGAFMCGTAFVRDSGCIRAGGMIRHQSA